jgi:N-acetylmuramoyl-L-alanine amidase
MLLYMSRNLFLSFPALFLFLAIIAGGAPATAAESAAPLVTIRAAKHADFFRIVLSAEDSLIQKAKVSARDGSSFRIDFPVRITAELGRKDAQGNPVRLDPASMKAVDLLKGASITARGSDLSLTIENLSDLKILRLSQPSRLVIDASIERKSQYKPESPLAGTADIQIQPDSLIIDPGHGGDEKGIHTASASEKDIVLGIARDLAATLIKRNKKAILTRKGDTALSISDRVALAQQVRGMPFLSIHLSLKKEVVVYFALSKKNTTFAEKSEAMAKRLATHLGQELRVPSRTEQLPGLFLAGIQSPAVLIELPSLIDTPYDKKMRERVLSGLLLGLSSVGKDDQPKQPEQVPSLKAPRPAEPSQQSKPKKKIADEI